MKILNIISQRPDSTGSGIYLQELMTQARASGHTNFLVCGLSGNDPINLRGIDPAHISAARFETRINPGAIIGMSDVMPYPSRTFRGLTSSEIDRYLEIFSETILSALNDCEPDIIHAHHLWLVGSILKELAPDIPVSLSCHGSDLRQFHQCPGLRRNVAQGCGKVERICCLTNSQKHEISKLYGIEKSRIEIVGAGYNESIFNTGKRPAPPEKRCTILYAGKLSRAKGVVWLLRALDSLSRNSFHLHLVGSGHGQEYRQVLAESENLGNRVTYHGPLAQNDLAQLMRLCDLFVLPSLFEGLPLVVLEALACGCRVVATDLPGCREIAARLPDGCLFLIPAPVVLDTAATRLDNEERFIGNLVDGLTPFLADKAGRPGNSSAISDLDYFRWRSVYRRIENVWQEMMSSYRHR